MLATQCCVGLLLIVLLRQSTGHGTLKDRTALYKKLSTDYQKDLAPTDKAVVVTHFLYIRRVAELENGVLTLETWEEMSWNDPRLTWDRKKYNVELLQLPSRLIWRPDIMLVNSAEQYNGHVYGDVLAVINYEGNVTFIPPKVTRAFCQFDESLLFQKDEVTCTLKYMSWTHSLKSMDIRVDKVREVLYNTNPKWKVEKISTARNIQDFHYHRYDWKYVDVDYIVKLKRVK